MYYINAVWETGDKSGPKFRARAKRNFLLERRQVADAYIITDKTEVKKH